MFKHDGELHCILYQWSSFCALMDSFVPPISYSFIYPIEILCGDVTLDEITQTFLVFP